MLFIQSRSQNIFNRFYIGLCKYYFFALPIFIGCIYRGEHISDVFYYLVALIALLILITLWLFVFNSGDGQVIEYGFEISDSEICYIKYGVRHSIIWQDFVTFSIINSYPRLVVIKAKNSPNIKFSYYTFSSEQREKIFEYLTGK